MAQPFATTWGPRIEPDGRVRFRLWAPGQPGLGLALADAAPVAMQSAPEGWFEVMVDRPAEGTRYQFVLGDGRRVADPASRSQPDGVHGPSAFMAPSADGTPGTWRGRPWHETVLYELHVGTFTVEGSFSSLAARLPELQALGITAVELMPIGAFPGMRGWGYDGVLPYAPQSSYGTPSELRALIDTAHGLGLMVFLDVIYNHFGPDGNFLPVYCPSFFREDRSTPWGAAIDYRRPAVRAFAIDNALYWLGEFGFDGLRLDAVHAIIDEGPVHVLDELTLRVRAAFPERHVHLVLENEHNEAHRLTRGPEHRPRAYDAQWNDDWHHCAHVLATGEAEAYYGTFADHPAERLVKAMATGFVFQGEPSPIHDGRPRGEPSGHLPPTAFVPFLQNHDQVGNRAMGDRLTTVAQPRAIEVLTALLLLSPSPPMLFMGEEWGSERPFLFFVDFEGELADAVRQGRRAEFKAFKAFADPEARARIPDPVALETFRQSTLDHGEATTPEGAARRRLVQRLLELRARHIVPALATAPGDAGTGRLLGKRAIEIGWRLGDGVRLAVLANLGAEPVAEVTHPGGAILFAWPDEVAAQIVGRTLPPWSCVFFFEPGGAHA